MPFYNATSGADTLIADGQDDTFVFFSGSVQAGDLFDAAGGVDRILIDGNAEGDFVGEFDFRSATVLGFESLEFTGGNFTELFVSFNHTQVGATFSVIGRGGGGVTDYLSVSLSPNASFSAAGWSFTNWGPVGLSIGGAAGVETIVGSPIADGINGESGNDTIYGGGGNDTLDGGEGDDSMFGGGGDDIYLVDSASDVFVEASALGGIDMVQTSVTRNLTANIENLNLIGVAAINGYGNGLNNVIIGNGAANALYGFEGADTLSGGGGDDVMFGGNGDDNYFVDDGGDITVEVSALGGTDTVFSSVNRNLNANFENLILTGAAQVGYGNVLNNAVTGNSGANAIYGFDGDDTLDGGAGADQMFGANGDDTYIVDNAGDVTSEVSALGGIDTVLSSVTRNLTANLENLTLTGNAAITGAGNALNNVLIGNGAANTLFGLDGADTLDGGQGGDTLQGGLGTDTYVFSSALGGGNVDTVVGFNVVDDTIRLNSAVFAGLSAGALDAAAFRVGSAAADADDRIIYNSATGALYFDADGAGGAAQIQFASLAAGLALTNADFIVGGP